MKSSLREKRGGGTRIRVEAKKSCQPTGQNFCGTVETELSLILFNSRAC